MTLVTVFEPLLPGTGSPTSLDLTVAVLLRGRSVSCVLVGTTTRVMTAVPFLASDAMVHSAFTQPDWVGLVQVPVPPLVMAMLLRPSLASRLPNWSLTTTLVAVSGPALCTVSV